MIDLQIYFLDNIFHLVLILGRNWIQNFWSYHMYCDTGTQKPVHPLFLPSLRKDTVSHKCFLSPFFDSSLIYCYYKIIILEKQVQKMESFCNI